MATTGSRVRAISPAVKDDRHNVVSAAQASAYNRHESPVLRQVDRLILSFSTSTERHLKNVVLISQGSWTRHLPQADPGCDHSHLVSEARTSNQRRAQSLQLPMMKPSIASNPVDGCGMSRSNWTNGTASSMYQHFNTSQSRVWVQSAACL